MTDEKKDKSKIQIKKIGIGTDIVKFQPIKKLLLASMEIISDDFAKLILIEQKMGVKKKEYEDNKKIIDDEIEKLIKISAVHEIKFLEKIESVFEKVVSYSLEILIDHYLESIKDNDNLIIDIIKSLKNLEKKDGCTDCKNCDDFECPIRNQQKNDSIVH